MDDGYDQAYEDRLFDAIEWPHDGYRLFEIGHFIGDRDWFDGVWESNCMFVPRELLEQVGGFDESFSMPGGGYANLELYERLGSRARRHRRDDPRRGLVPPGARRHDHQPARRRRAAGAGLRLRRALRRAARPARSAARASRSTTSAGSRVAGGAAHEAAAAVGRDVRRGRRRPGRRRPARRTPTPMPDELRVGVHRGGLAQPAVDSATTWLGRRDRDARRPTCSRTRRSSPSVRPDWIIETGTGDGGRALFLASICELVGHGEVLSIDAEPRRRPARATRACATSRGRPRRRDGRAQVREIVGDGRALVVLGSVRRPRHDDGASSRRTRRSCRSAPTSSSRTRS